MDAVPHRMDLGTRSEQKQTPVQDSQKSSQYLAGKASVLDKTVIRVLRTHQLTAASSRGVVHRMPKVNISG
jgi:hypothetical protein